MVRAEPVGFSTELCRDLWISGARTAASAVARERFASTTRRPLALNPRVSDLLPRKKPAKPDPIERGSSFARAKLMEKFSIQGDIGATEDSSRAGSLKVVKK